MFLTNRLADGPKVLFALAALVSIATFAPGSAFAETQSPQWTVTAVSGPTNFQPAANETQNVTIAAGGGTFTLSFGGQSTGAIAYNATPAVVQSELDALSSIGGAGGSVTVTGGPGNSSGSNPYAVTFSGSLGGIEVEQLTVGSGSLFDVVGDTIGCTAGPTGTVTYQWLRNGQPIAGATSSTYTTVAADAGDAIQCMTTAARGAGDPASAAASEPPRLVAPVPGTPVPAPLGQINVEGEPEVGETLTCEAGSWTGSPTFTYQWLKDGAQIPGATSKTFVVEAADVPSSLQCEAIGANAGGSVAQVGFNENTIPGISFPERPPLATSTSALATVSIQTAGGSSGFYSVTVMNTGAAASDGSTVTIADTLPSGVTLGAAGASGQENLSGVTLSCTGPTCTYSGVVVPGDFMTLKIPVVIGPGAGSSVTNTVTVFGGGALEASISTPTTVSSTPAEFGIAPGSAATALSSTQAGAHASLTTMLTFDTSDKLNEGGNNYILAGDPRSTIGDLPPGFAGDLADTPTCPVSIFSKQTEFHGPQKCPLSTQVGTIILTLGFHSVAESETLPVYNLTPNPGEVAKLGFLAAVYNIQGTISVRPGDYHVRTAFMNINESPAALDGASLTVWGVPSEHSHDAMRGLICGNVGSCEYWDSTGLVPGATGLSSTSPAIPFLTNPMVCSGVPLRAELSSSSWQEPSQVVTAAADMGPMTGCNLLEFSPWLTASPDTTHADTPAGLTANVKVPQEGLTSPEGLSTADIKNTVVTLPAGVAINPGQAAGLVACQESEAGVGQEGPASCPNGSKVGTDEIETPILKRKLEGNVYVLQSNPPNLKLLVTAYAPIYGIYVKLVGTVHLDEATGQLMTKFANTPELPFSDFKLSFSGGAQAALVTPTTCGTYGTTASFMPWSTPATKGVTSASAFAITSGPGGSACTAPLPFSPSLIAGATTDQAGGFTDFSLLLQRGDGQQRIERLQFKAPAGLSAMLSRVPLCPEPQASQGTCSAASHIGHAAVSSGPGPYPLVLPQPGASELPIYLTGPYKGAPFGLSIVTRVLAGPFDLGTIVTRAKIEVDPTTAQITVATDPLPQIVAGVPTDLRLVNAVIDRPGFMFNPTSCSPQAFVGTAWGTPPPDAGGPGATAPIGSHFQVGSCRSLEFAPAFKASVSGKTSKANGASLSVKLTYPNAPQGSEANIHSVKVDLPKQLPSRLTTLQKACTAAQFEANPAGCPAASIVGHAKAITPLLPVPVEGPAYFVSHGGEAFPSLILVLQGYGVTVDLVGTTFISKAGITSSTFKTVPDVPVGSFELTLPRGKFSALTANGSLCQPTRTVIVRKRVARRVHGRVVHVERTIKQTVTQALQMPTGFVAQNGAQFSQTTKIAVTGCPKKKAKKASAHHGKGKAQKKR